MDQLARIAEQLENGQAESYAREIGADAFAFDGLSAIDRVRRLVEENQGNEP